MPFPLHLLFLLAPLPLSLRATSPRRAMAYTCSAASNAGLVDNLLSAGLIHSARVEAAMRAVDRRLFVPDFHTSPYRDHPHSLPCAATISAPHMHAMALEKLEHVLQPGARALDVGAGSGYLMACMAVMVGNTGHVVGVEHVPQLADLACQNLRNWDAAIVDAGVVSVRASDGRDGAPDKAPFAAIHVGAAAPTVPPALLEQLAPGGIMVIPVGAKDYAQNFEVVRKDESGVVTKETVCGVRYVPLCDLDHQLETR